MLDIITDNLDVWTTAKKNKKAVGRGSSKKQEAYGIKKLRELILELAVRGKLVLQDASDEPASVLLERIAEEKQQLVAEGKVKKQRKITEITEDEKSFLLPNSWKWSRFTDCYDVRDGTHDSPKAQGEGFPLVTSKNLYTGTLDLTNVNYISEEDHKKIILRSKVDKGDILFAMIGSIGNPVIVDIDEKFSIKNVALFKYYLPELSVPRYLQIYLKLASVIMKEKASGGVQSFVSLGILRSYVMAVPPLAEQHRIVAKVDELMALCDQLEQQQSDQSATHQTLVETLLNGLIESAKPSTNDQQSTADFFNQLIAQHFDTLFTTEQSIDQLKQTILQLAVMGKLVPQDPKDEPASVLLEKIAEEKAGLIEAGKIKKQKALPEIGEDEKPFELPDGWESCCFGHIINLVSGQHLKPSEYSKKELDGMVPYLTGPAEFGIKSPSPTRFTSEHRAVSLEGNVLITCKGSGVGKLNITKETTAISRQLMSLQPIIVSTNFSLLLAESLNAAIREKIVGIAIPGISREDVTEAKIFLPPLAEQHRIVKKVNQLLTLCDSLKANLNQAHTTQTQLADAIVKQAVN